MHARSWMSVLVTAAILVALIHMLPTEDQMQTNLQNRMQDLDEGACLVRRAIPLAARHLSGYYPRGATTSSAPTLRFYDPWGRPYLYEATDAGVTLRSLGRDGKL